MAKLDKIVTLNTKVIITLCTRYGQITKNVTSNANTKEIVTQHTFYGQIRQKLSLYMQIIRKPSLYAHTREILLQTDHFVLT